jgi:Zinc carboxypeptidase/Cytosolic carboxypeptidase N-terminal domain
LIVKSSKNDREDVYENNKLIKKFDDKATETIKFESRFESGNLRMASKINDAEYNLLLQNDVNTNKNTQWFYFRIKNTLKGPIKINILNFCKEKSLYQFGMQVSVYSKKHYKLTKEGWHKGGYNITYAANNILQRSFKSYYTLSFEYEFQHPNDKVFFAYSVPYTYTDLAKLLDAYEQDPRISQFCVRKNLCRSLGGNMMHYLTLTEPAVLEDLKKKEVVVITARVHPGETISSYMMLGVLNFLTGESDEAKTLRAKYIFKIIPMLNPDGVINGNYRCSLLGVDLNRRWKNPHSKLHPEIYHSKKFISSLSTKYKIAVIVDFHGHSIKKNIFMYGCSEKDNLFGFKLFPYLLSKSSNFLYFPYCNFSMHKSKESTLRMALYRDLKVINTYTVEASFCGGSFGKYRNLQYSTGMLYEFAEEFCRSLVRFKDLLRIKNLSEASSRGLVGLEGTLRRSFEFDGVLESFFNSESQLKDLEAHTDGSDDGSDDENCNETLVLKIIKNKNTKIDYKNNPVSVSSKILPRFKCKLCGKYDFTGHKCLRPISLPKNSNKVLEKIQETSNNDISTIHQSSEKLQDINNRKISTFLHTTSTKIKENNTHNISAVVYSLKKKIRSEKTHKSKELINKTFLSPIKDQLSMIETDEKAYEDEARTLLYPKSKERAFYIRGPRSVSPLNNVHMLGIVEGVSCRLMKVSRIGIRSTKKYS